MGGEIAIGGAELGEPGGDELEMRGLLIGDIDPIVEESAGQLRRGEAGDQVPGEIDGVELDMGEGVEEGDAPTSPGPALRLGISFGASSSGLSGRAGRSGG